MLQPDGIRRESVRKAEFRQPGFEADFDSSTLFYDVILSRHTVWTDLIFVGPPLLNLLPSFCDGRIGPHPIAATISHYYLRDRCCDVWIPKWNKDAVELTFDFGSYTLKPEPARNDLYNGRRVLYTLSKDNEVDWIVDWARFHVCNHGANGVLIYDNASTRYTGEELEQTLRAAFPGLAVNVVDWPYKYGPEGISKYDGWDSDFCQAGAFQDARFRFLEQASSVLNCDIDELVLSVNGESVFEATENSPTGCTMFNGSWISNATLPANRSGRESSSQIRHRDFRYLERSGPCPMKWCAVPRLCKREEHWITHTLAGKDVSACRSEAFSYRHFRSISTNWKYQRCQPTDVAPELHSFDGLLDRFLTRAE